MTTRISGQKSATAAVRSESAPAAKAPAKPRAKTPVDTLVKAEAKTEPSTSKKLRTVVIPPPDKAWSPPSELTVSTTDPKAVYDGDTFHGVDVNGAKYSVRCSEYNATERRPAQFGWEEAQQEAERLIRKAGGKVELEYTRKDPRDDYGRIVARVRVGGELLAKKLIEKGLVMAYFIVDNVNDGFDRSELVAAQKVAQDAKLGIWANPEYQKELVMTSWHPNGRGNDQQNPNIEYLRLCNTSQKPLKFGGYTITNKAGKTFTMPEVTVPVGHTIQIFSGRGENKLNPPEPIKIYMGSRTEVWNNTDDRLTLRNRKGELVLERLQKQPGIDTSKLAERDTLSQKDIKKLGSDVEVTYTGPSRIPVEKFNPSDGDTFAIPMLKTGLFKVTIEGRLTRPLEISQGDQTDKGMIDVRFLGVDTPETEVLAKLPTGEMVFASQGLPGEEAKKALYKLLSGATNIQVAPNKSSPFDFYSRLLGTVYATVKENGKNQVINVNHWLIEQGHGEMMSTWSPDFDVREHEEKAAKAKLAFDEKRGIYSDGEAHQFERPAEFRRRVTGRPPGSDMVVDWTTKLVYPASKIDSVDPWKRVFIMKKDMDVAMRDKRFNFKLAKVTEEEAPVAAAPAKKKAPAKKHTPRSNTVSVMRSQVDAAKAQKKLA